MPAVQTGPRVRRRGPAPTGFAIDLQMKILAISDIHNNVACVRKLRSQEANEFDVIAIAGDIGDYRAKEIFDVLKTFRCPIVYVHGNWDSKLGYNDNFGPDCHLLHLNVVK